MEPCAFELEDDQVPRKQIKTVSQNNNNNILETKTPTNGTVITRRNVFFRFGNEDSIHPCKIILKEPWGYLVESVEDINEAALKGAKYWCKWDGTVNDLSIPVVEVMYPLNSS